MSPLVLGEVLGVFLNTLTANDKYPVQDLENLQLAIQMQLFKKGKRVPQFFFHFRNLHQILNILKEKTIVIANVFPKLQIVKIFVRPLSKKPPFRARFDSQHVKSSQILSKFPGDHFYHVFSSFSGKLISKFSPLVLGEILGVFVNILTAHAMYPLPDCEYLQLAIRMQLSEKRKAFYQFFVPFLESTSNFKYFEKKDDRHS